MRAILVGSLRDRARLRSQLADLAIDIVGEFGSVGEAQRADLSADAIVMAGADAGEPEVAVEPLTPRELDVLALVAEGRSNKAIADALGISDQTVKFHVAS